MVIFHDHGSRYLGKMFNPDWMRMMGYENLAGPTARDLVKNKRVTDVVGVEVTATVEQAIMSMSENDFSQIPITQQRRIVGLAQRRLRLFLHRQGSEDAQRTGQGHHAAGVPLRGHRHPGAAARAMITPDNPAVLVRDFKADKTYILTGHDVLKAI